MSNKTPKTQKTQYEILGVDVDASHDDIKRAYRTLAKDTHPDLNSGKNGGFEAIKKAYEVLSDPKRRKVYDSLIGIVHSNPTIDRDHIDALRGAIGSFWNTYSTGYTPSSPQGQTKQSLRNSITIPRRLILSISSATQHYGNMHPWGMVEIEVNIGMNGVPWFGPDDILRLEYDISDNHGYLDIIVKEVSFSSSLYRGGFEAMVRGIKI